MRIDGRWVIGVAVCATAWLAVGCGEDEEPASEVAATTYVAFSEAHYENQLLRLAAYETIASARRDAAGQATAADANRVYVETIEPSLQTAELMVKVQGRTDDHDFATDPAVGVQLEADILYGLELGSTTDDLQRVAYAGQIVDKTLLAFFYYSVFHELKARTKKNFDEAFGYYGLPNDGDVADARGLARTAVGREGDFGVSLNQPIFGTLLDGRAVLASALGDDAADATAALGESAEYDAVVEELDRQMLLIFALGVKHEMEEVAEEEPDVKLIEANRFWKPLRGWVAANVASVDGELLDAQLLGELEGDALIEGLEAVKADPSGLDPDAVIAEIDKVIAALQ